MAHRKIIILVNGKMADVLDYVCTYFKICKITYLVLVTLVMSPMILNTDKERSISKMEITLLESIKMGNLMDMENTSGAMEIFIKDNLLMVCEMVREYGKIKLEKE